MEEQNKYYTPDIEDIRHGYEYEYLNINGDEDVWEKAIFPNPHYHEQSGWVEYNAHSHLVNIRTKYLDKSDIESCGWTCQEYTQDGYNQRYTKNVDSESGYDLIYCAAWDKKWQINDCGYGIYWGEIKSINELRKIMQWLKIK